MRRGLELAKAYQFHPGYAIYEPAFLRLGAALERAYPGVPQPIYRFMFSTGFSFGFPPESIGLDANLHLLAREAAHAPWMIAGLDVDILPLVEYAVQRGGHVRVGLEDAPLGTSTTNLQWVDAAVMRINAAGGMLASANDIRRLMAGRTGGGHNART